METVRPVGLGQSGAFGLSVSGSSRRWSYFHENYCVTVVRSGHGRWRYRGRDAEVSSRALMLMEPGEVHATTAVHAPGDFLAIFVAPSLVDEIVEHLDVRQPHFRSIEATRGDLVEAFARVARGAEAGVGAPELREQLTLSLGQLFRDFTERPPRQHDPTTRVRHAARLLRECYESAPRQAVLIEPIARAVGMSYHWLVHGFTRQYGIPPYQYVQALRLARVRCLLACGPGRGLNSLDDVATAVGYADEPHLRRCVRRYHGLVSSQLAASLHPGWRRGA